MFLGTREFALTVGHPGAALASEARSDSSSESARVEGAVAETQHHRDLDFFAEAFVGNRNVDGALDGVMLHCECVMEPDRYCGQNCAVGQVYKKLDIYSFIE